MHPISTYLNTKNLLSCFHFGASMTIFIPVPPISGAEMIDVLISDWFSILDSSS